MKTLVKVKYLPVFALLLGSTLALATTSRTAAPQFYKDQDGDWQSLVGKTLGSASGQYRCNSNEDDCTAEGLDENSNPIGNITRGQLVQNP
jgi:hypothetical protein